MGERDVESETGDRDGSACVVCMYVCVLQIATQSHRLCTQSHGASRGVAVCAHISSCMRSQPGAESPCSVRERKNTHCRLGHCPAIDPPTFSLQGICRSIRLVLPQRAQTRLGAKLQIPRVPHESWARAVRLFSSNTNKRKKFIQCHSLAVAS